MKPKRIILIRHGESEGNIDRAVFGKKPDYAFLLTEKGQEQALNAGERLRSLVGDETLQFYVSPLFSYTTNLPADHKKFSSEPISVEGGTEITRTGMGASPIT